LQNKPLGSYKELFKEVSHTISAKKCKRYSSEDLLHLNNIHTQGTECKICRAVREAEEDVCDLCSALIAMSSGILKQYDKYEEDVFFVVTRKPSKESVPLSETLFVETNKEYELREKLNSDNDIVRYYVKNKFYIGKNLGTRLWVGDYCKEKEISKYAEQSCGIDRIGALRMDVDDLGKAFTSGFSEEYNTLSRTGTFSRHLSMFFKRSINMLLHNSKRAVTVIYSGGDDMFLLGAWDDIIDTALEINDAFHRYAGGKLTLSAGIGLYPGKYPVHIMARETGDLENHSKISGENKNAVTLFSPELCFGWDEFKNRVVEEKLKIIKDYFSEDNEKGNSFLYKILEYIRAVESEEGKNEAKISLARCAYMFSRIEPSSDDTEKKQKFKKFSENMYGWMKEIHGRKQLKAAICLYVYSKREVLHDDGN
jgi:CRISPR-associated protein Csm1